MFNCSNNNIIILIFVLIFCFIFYIISELNNLKKSLTNKVENFTTQDDINTAVKKIYLADVEAIRLLSNFAIQLSQGGFTIPGNVNIGGALTVSSSINAGIVSAEAVKIYSGENPIEINNDDNNTNKAEISRWLINNKDNILAIRGHRNNTWGPQVFKLTRDGALTVTGSINTGIVSAEAVKIYSGENPIEINNNDNNTNTAETSRWLINNKDNILAIRGHRNNTWGPQVFKLTRDGALTVSNSINITGHSRNQIELHNDESGKFSSFLITNYDNVLGIHGLVNGSSWGPQVFKLTNTGDLYITGTIYCNKIVAVT